MALKWNFQRGWGVQAKKTFRGGGMDTFWNNTTEVWENLKNQWKNLPVVLCSNSFSHSLKLSLMPLYLSGKTVHFSIS